MGDNFLRLPPQHVARGASASACQCFKLTKNSQLPTKTNSKHARETLFSAEEATTDDKRHRIDWDDCYAVLGRFQGWRM